MKRRYVVGILIAALILIANQVFIQYWLAQKKYDANAINVSGRQRMLSQRINLAFYRVAEGTSPYDTLQYLFKKWEQTHQALLAGSQKLALEPVQEPRARALLLELSDNIAFIDLLLSKNDTVTTDDLPAITENQSAFLTSMEKVVKILEQESERKLQFIVITEIMLMLLSLTVLTLEVRYIYMPIEKKLKRVLSQVREQNRNKLRAIYESTIDASVFIDQNFVVQYSNKNAKKLSQAIFGKRVEVGKYLLDTMPVWFREEMERYYQEALLGNTVEFEKFDGKRWWQFNLMPVYNKSDQIIGISQNVRDVTQRNQLLEENRVMARRLKLIAENFPNGSISLIDQDLNILYTNGERYHRLGIDSQAMVGKSLQTVLSPDLYEQFERAIPSIMAGKTVEFQANYQDQHFLNIIQPVPSETDDFSRFILTSTDITDLMKYQNLILDQNQQLRAIAWMQSHELRGPLSTIKGLVNLMIIEKEQGLNIRYLEGLQATSEQLDRVIKRIVKETSETKKAEEKIGVNEPK